MTKLRAPPLIQPTLFNLRPVYIPIPPETPPQIMMKKPYYRPILKNPIILKEMFPYKFEDQSFFITPPLRQQPKKPAVQVFKKAIPFLFVERSMNPKIVEISPEQASTEKEPRTTTERPFAQLMNITPSKIHYSEDMPIAVNTGFRPESVVIEGGFKPIVSKEVRDRLRKADGPELEYESEIGVIDVSMDNNRESGKTFEPVVYEPSPFDKASARNKYKSKPNRNKNVMFIIKESRSGRGDVYDDEVADADERVDSYYLPPDNQRTKPVVHIMKPSNIDVAPGTVVSYDGKKVSGASLTAKFSNGGSIFDGRASKAAELIKAGPQYGPFRGDLPPLDPNFFKKNPAQLQFQRVLSRDLETPPPLQEPTKLILVRQFDGDDFLDKTRVTNEQ